ncbi:N-acetylmuramoyl-L-alanine amidase [Enterococcus sp.]|uniref:N-acetylmuramoyl-L-alanine amidase family protein n=1 Tax=Enterococcus sp. TaxID=35783 RepID=UPI000EE222DE|nr:N-acetylmuramoyl-L-alanine amidase [Enterococcus sp.]HAB96558.1 N-acetylmuramoyl-L-alanine amidase [Enterococcus sp.]
MKKKGKLVIGTTMILLFATGFAVLRNDQSAREESQESTSQTEPNAQTEETAQTVSMVRIYVDPSEYDAAVESENDYVSIYQTTSQETVIGKIHRGSWATFISQTEEMVEIQTDDGVTGYIEKQSASIQEVALSAVPKDLSNFKVVLDAGHGGEDSGALSTDQTIMEKDLTLATVQTIGEALTKAGIQVSYTRTEDRYLTLSDITAASLSEEPDLFISIHYDNSEIPNSNQGLTTYYYYTGAKEMAETITANLSSSVALSSNGTRFGNYYVLREQYIPAVLLELGYLNSDTDLSVITSDGYDQKVAQALLAAIKEIVEAEE